MQLTGTAATGKNLYNPYVWDVFLNQIESQAAFTPLMFATGNHDMEPLFGATKLVGDSPSHGYAGHAKRLDFPTNGSETCPSVYRFQYANVGVISIDDNDLNAEIQTNTGYSNGAQLKWLGEALKQWRTPGAAGAGVDFIVGLFHHCAYSTTINHASDGALRDALDLLFTKYQVDLVVQGHNHLFERSDPIRNKRRTKAAPDGSTIRPGRRRRHLHHGGLRRAPALRVPPRTGPHRPGRARLGSVRTQLLPEGQRYRSYQPTGGANLSENNTENVVNSCGGAGVCCAVAECRCWVVKERFDTYVGGAGDDRREVFVVGIVTSAFASAGGIGGRVGEEGVAGGDPPGGVIAEAADDQVGLFVRNGPTRTPNTPPLISSTPGR